MITTLPLAVNRKHDNYLTIRNGSTTDFLEIDTQFGDTIEGLASITIYPGESITLSSDETSKWWRVFDLTNRSMRWRGTYNALSGQYWPMDVVRDGQWLMIANKPTNQQPAPYPIGTESWLIPDSPSWASDSIDVAYLYSGNRYTVPADKAYFINAVRAYIPKVSSTLEYQVALRNRCDPNNIKITLGSLFIPSATGWITLDSFPDTLIPPGCEFDVEIRVRDNQNYSTWTARYDYTTPVTGANPLTGEVDHPNNMLDTLVFHQTDEDGNDQTGNLMALKIGDKIIGNELEWEITDLPTQSGTDISIKITPLMQQSIDEVQTFAFRVYGTQPLDYEYVLDYWSGNANISGYMYSAETGLTEDNNAYGTDILVQEAYMSPDWNLLARS